MGASVQVSESIATGSAAHAGTRTSASQDERALRYRPDIDGLRALAILPILLLHCGVTKLRGGFVGVDIFFVISGFLITAIMVRDIVDGRFSIARFYRHRIFRILPALLVMMTVTLALGCVLLLPNQLRDLGRSAAATSVTPGRGGEAEGFKRIQKSCFKSMLGRQALCVNSV